MAMGGWIFWNLILDERGGPVAGVYAAGDVARWSNTHFEEEMRVEHWTNAAEQGAEGRHAAHRSGPVAESHAAA